MSRAGPGIPVRPALGDLPNVRSNPRTEPQIRPQVRAMVRQGLIVYFLLVIFEGVMRKWLLPDFNEYIYIAKDGVLAFLCLRVVLSQGYIPVPQALRRSNAGQLFIAFAIYSFCQGFNFLLPNTILGIWGIRTYVLPMSLVYLVPLGMPDARTNERYFRYYLLLGIPVAMLCMAQYRLPATHILNRYANLELGKQVSLVGDAVRVTGPFSYISGLGTYLAFEVAGVLGVLFAARWKLKGNKLIWLSLLLTIGVVPMTGSRAIALYCVLYVLIVVALSPLMKQGSGAPSRMLLAVICLSSLSIGMYGAAFDRLAERSRTAGDTGNRFYNLFVLPLELLGDAGLVGFGAAATNQAARVLVPNGDAFYWLPNGWVEDEAGRVVLELGGIGFLLYIALKIAVCAFVFQYIRRYGHDVPLSIPVACLLTAASCMITGMLFSSVGSSFYWGLFGLFIAQANATRVLPRTS